MGIKPASSEIRKVYAKSLYRAGPVLTRINRIPQGMENIEHGKSFLEWGMVSAYNPGGKRHPEGWNHRMFAHLQQELEKAGFVYYYGIGSLYNQEEPLFMVAVPRGRLYKLARKYRQNAVVLLQKGRRSRLVFWGRE
ncbi:DUF3293 domain-containing protein [Entomobacter blattae]|uniref:DUF3293 domain-containing protein n=1 Tax=Entomobacter blattae TaxID=2762277 RepID=A0A7H1NUS7_9PROT|nr:DUF3293 domain-containing protein [Entomobacter blattae]QNT79537.1 hypothetical protein JGUZn3_23370 [Entomobacter blattae]